LHWTIDHDKIKDTSIRLGMKQGDEVWTRACKYTLTCCKFLLACVSNLTAQQFRAAAAAAAAQQQQQPPFVKGVISYATLGETEI
ncbi:autophagy protein 6, partial [Ascosphaera acerosa]